MSSGRVTSRDVAEAAGVSRATVSHVLNGAPGRRVSDATRARVLEVAARLGYEPHGAAAALRAGRTTIVLVALPAWPLGPPMAQAVSTAVAELERLGYTPLVHFTPADDLDALARACARAQPVGVIAPASALDPARVTALRARGAPGVMALGGAPLDHVPTFAFDQAQVGRIALEHLADRGHTRVLAVAPDDPALEALVEERLGGAAGAAANGRAVTLTRLIAPAEALAERLPAALDGHTALLAFNDEHALAAAGALADRGLRIPENVAIVGCDDSAAARWARPRLATIRLVDPDLWREVARRLDRAIAGEDVSHVRAEPRLIPGAST